MSLDVNGKNVEVTETGFLVNPDDWDRDVATALAADEEIDMTDKHWDVVNYLREEYFDNHGNQPNTRTMVKDMGKRWGAKIGSKDLFDLFPGNPSKQAGRIGGLPESRRKGGY